MTKERLEEMYGEVWDTKQTTTLFTVHSFGAPFVSVTRLSDNTKGSLEFQHDPRFYFNFKEN